MERFTYSTGLLKPSHHFFRSSIAIAVSAKLLPRISPPPHSLCPVNLAYGLIRDLKIHLGGPSCTTTYHKESPERSFATTFVSQDLQLLRQCSNRTSATRESQPNIYCKPGPVSIKFHTNYSTTLLQLPQTPYT
jgi:hypothetical protein